jgi:hypothetical protein
VVAKSNSGEAAHQGGGDTHTYVIPPANMTCKKACSVPRRGTNAACCSRCRRGEPLCYQNVTCPYPGTPEPEGKILPGAWGNSFSCPCRRRTLNPVNGSTAKVHQSLPHQQ